MITIKNYVRPESLEEAWLLNGKKRNRIVGGMLWLKMGSGSVDTAIDLCNLGLDSIEETEDAFKIGAMVSLRQLEQHPGLESYSCGAVRKAVQDIVGVQFRNLASVGGSLWGRFGFSDVLTVFSAMDCAVELYKGGIVPLETFVSMKKDNDILVRLIVKKTSGKFVYMAMRNQRTDFPILTCAASEMNGETKLSIGARPHKAMLVRDTENLCSKPDGVRAFALFASQTVPTGSNLRGSAAYRTHLVRVLSERCLEELGGMR